MATEVVIPMLGVTIETGIIVEWLKKEGDPVKKGESLFVVEADKVVAEVESPATGLLAKILLPVGQKVPVLTVVAVITEPGETLPARYLRRRAGRGHSGAGALPGRCRADDSPHRAGRTRTCAGGPGCTHACARKGHGPQRDQGQRP